MEGLVRHNLKKVCSPRLRGGICLGPESRRVDKHMHMPHAGYIPHPINQTRQGQPMRGHNSYLCHAGALAPEGTDVTLQRSIKKMSMPLFLPSAGVSLRQALCGSHGIGWFLRNYVVPMELGGSHGIGPLHPYGAYSGRRVCAQT